MPRATNNAAARQKRNKVMKQARGYVAGRGSQFRMAREQVERAGVHEYIGRKQRKRDFRRLWIVRINAACRLQGMSYSNFINGLKKANIDIDRKQLADLAVRDMAGFAKLAETARAAL
ncbi:50S ribosomal protein L20 [bacterium]|nr:50S ribosomal protein L20 [bacterium]HPF34994.1 50S ribosomal protein L20 [Candidatus Krumholzibacteria bacterium]HRX50721.1 50S ribosomal protein L20 [Candidatus Krumholzibacteria bacterium]